MATATALGYNSDFSIGTGFTSTNGPQQIITDSNKTKLYFVGGFSSYKGTTQNRVSVQNYFGNIISDFNVGSGPNGLPSAFVLQSDGKLLLGGGFTTFSGDSTPGMVRLNSNGTIDSTFNIGGGFGLGSPFDIQVQTDGKILVGGSFSTYSGVTVNRFLRLNSDATIDNSFLTNLGTGASSNVLVIQIQSNDKIILGGIFSTFNNVTCNGIIRLNSDGTIDNTFTSELFSSLDGPQNNGIKIQSDGKILAVGTFTTYGGVSSSGIVRINSGGTRDSTFNMGTGFLPTITPPRVVQIQSDGKILVGGGSTSYSGVSANKIIRLNSDGTIDTTFNYGTGFTQQVYDILVNSDGSMFVVGTFTSYSGVTSNGYIKLNSNGSVSSGTTTITGTQQIGSLAIATATTVNYSPSTNGGVTFWMGPDEELGYVVGVPVSGGTQTTPIGGVNAFLGFYRSASLTEPSFLSIVNSTFNQSLTTGGAAKTYLNNNGYWTSWNTPSSVLIGYYSSTSVFINDCTATFTAATPNLPLYMAYLYSGFTYSLGQLPNNDYTTGVPFYTDANLTTPLPTLFGPIYAFSPTQGGRPYRKIRIGSTYDGWDTCGPLIANGYMVESATKVNVGNSQRDFIPNDDTSSPYPGKKIYQAASGSFFSNGTTWAWAAQPNVTATHLLFFNNSGSWISTIS
jgi:uncharacterized delta-60 repeat protein